MANTTKKTTTSTKSSTKKDDILEQLQSENKELKEQMDKLMALLENQSQPSTNAISGLDSTLDRDIPVMSLIPHKLNLCTEFYGKGNVYTFTEMYEVMEIPWGDLKEIVRVNKDMARNGKFYVMDEQAVSSLRLKGAYKTIINPDKLQALLNNVHTSQDLIEIYKLAPQGQQQTIVEILRDKRLYNEKVDMNVLNVIGELSGVNLMDTSNVPDLPPKEEK